MVFRGGGVGGGGGGGGGGVRGKANLAKYTFFGVCQKKCLPKFA